MAVKLEACQPLFQALPPYLQYHEPAVARVVFKLMECVVEVGLQLKDARSIPASAYDQWLTLLCQYPQQNYDAARQAGGKALENYVKCVKRIALISFAFINHASNASKTPPIATHFMKVYAVQFFLVWKEWLTIEVPPASLAVYKDSFLRAISYIRLCANHEALYREHMRPQALLLIEKLFFPFLCFTEEDEEIFADQDGLSEFVQYMTEQTIGGGVSSLREEASHAITGLIGGKKKFHDASGLLQEVLRVLTSGLSLEDSEGTFGRVFGFLHLLCILRKYLKQVPEIWSGQMAHVLKQYVAPRLQPNNPFVPLRCKALEVCQRFAKVPMTEEDYGSFIQMMGGLVQDNDPRVRLTAIDAMCTLLEKKQGRQYLKPLLVPLVEECMQFMDRVRTTFVPTVILHLATYFSPELGPVMGRLGQTLVRQFLATAFDLSFIENEADESNLAQYEMAAHSGDALLQAISTVVCACENNPAALVVMRPDVVRLIRTVLEQPDSFDYMESALGICVHIVVFSKPVPQECWDILPLLFKCVEEGIGVDFFSIVEEVLDNFISNDPLTYMQNAPLMERTYNICSKMLLGGVVCLDECQIAVPQLIQALLHQAKGSAVPSAMSGYLQRFALLLLQALISPAIQASGVAIRVWVIAAIMDCFYYDAQAMLDIVSESGAYPNFFDGFFYFLRGCLEGPQAAPEVSGKKKKSKKKTEEAYEVVEALSLLTRKVIALGLAALLPVVCQADHPLHAHFVEHYLATAVAVIQYCLFTNCAKYEARCAVMKHEIYKIQHDIEDEVADTDDNPFAEDAEEGDLGASADDLSEAEYCDVDGAGGAPAGMEPDEGDDYSGPIDDVNEVQVFGQWCTTLPALGPHVQQQAGAALRSEQELLQAAAVAATYRSMYKEYEQVCQEDYHKRTQS
ncbi:importin 7 [Strigomonas culicis]|nr:importin 7 [Strigomonas culicis]|eukprot:EPY21495.1 importin 7 [Strigomonas culicis]